LTISDDISNCKGAYRSSDGIALLIGIDRETLRGSGRSLAPAVTSALGVQPGQNRTFAGDGYSIRVTWPMTGWAGGSLGSIRDLARSVEAQPGARMLLHFDTKRELVSGDIVDEAIASAPSWSQALRELTGVDAAEPAEALQRLAAAIGVEGTRVRGALRNRGDEEVAALLMEEAVNSGLQSALEDLARALEQE